MRAHRLCGTRSDGGDAAVVAGLIGEIGYGSFPAAMFRATSGWARPEHMTAFLFDRKQSPRMIFAENVGPARVAQDVAEKYCRDYWRYDLAQRASDKTGSDHGWILQTSAAEIEHLAYRHHCYTALSLDDRISVSDTRDGRTLRINLYRGEGSAFSADDIGCIADKALLMLALVRRHAQCRITDRPNSHDTYRARLASAAPSLTPREADVCAAIIRGLTSEGIAIQLGVGVNTVLTYKKRAYARLNISSQNQLMRLVLD